MVSNMTIENKIKHIESYYNEAQELHKKIKSPFKGTFKPEFSASKEEGLEYIEFIMSAIGYVSYALEIIKELQQENATLKAQVDRVRDTENLYQIIISVEDISYETDFLGITESIQSYILGGENEI
jgi:hypothetical protein